jgi:multimeric flavodoxin WrbA
MKILGINGSAKKSKSQTLQLVKSVLNGAKSKGADVELVELSRLQIEYCNACGSCHKTGKCLKKDAFQDIYKKILAADGLVMGSPNYFRSVTAQMKTIIDRMADAVHCQLLSGKYSVNVATSGGLGQHKQVTDYLNTIMLNFGTFVTGSVGVAIRSGQLAFTAAEKKAFHLGELLANDIKTRKIYKNQKLIHKENAIYFRKLVNMHKKEWGHEYKYWNEKR